MAGRGGAAGIRGRVSGCCAPDKSITEKGLVGSSEPPKPAEPLPCDVGKATSPLWVCFSNRGVTMRTRAASQGGREIYRRK